MDIKLAEAMVEIINNEGHEAEVRTDYSGRGMYGTMTAGFVTDMSPGHLLGVLIQNAEFIAEEIGDLDELEEEFIGSFRTDNMGYDTIYY